jgi:hypothetical protein
MLISFTHTHELQPQTSLAPHFRTWGCGSAEQEMNVITASELDPLLNSTKEEMKLRLTLQIE